MLTSAPPILDGLLSKIEPGLASALRLGAGKSTGLVIVIDYGEWGSCPGQRMLCPRYVSVTLVRPGQWRDPGVLLRQLRLAEPLARLVYARHDENDAAYVRAAAVITGRWLRLPVAEVGTSGAWWQLAPSEA